jgi:hypothetical protein
MKKKLSLRDLQYKMFKQMQEFLSVDGFALYLKSENPEWAIPVAGALYSDEQRRLGRSDASIWREAPDLNRHAEWEDLIYAGRLQAQRGLSVIFQPLHENRVLLLDDVKDDHLKYYQGYGMMTICTSPGNNQVWIRFGEDIDTEVLRDLSYQHSPDNGATPGKRKGRMPGFRNQKPKYVVEGQMSPLAIIIRRTTGFQTVDSVKELPIYRDAKPVFTATHNKRPDFTSPTLFKEPLAWAYFDKGDHSQTDLTWAIHLAGRGLGIDEIENELKSNGRPDPEKKRKGYFRMIAGKALNRVGKGGFL